jgi:hypothetical protein
MHATLAKTLAGSEAKKSALSHRVLGAALTAIACLAWILPYWNRFAGVSSAGMPFYIAEQILKGRVPYRDFYLVIPPLHLLKSALLIHLFGPNLAAMRFESVIERALFAGLVCWWLSRFFRPAACFVAVLFAMALFAGDIADALVSYHHDAAILAVVAGFCASLFLGQSSRSAWPMAILSGICAGMTFMTAQTVGAAITLCVPTVICAVELRSQRYRTALGFLAGYALGWLIPTGLIAIWLYRQHALPQFIQCIFLSGSSKGSAIQVFARPFWDRKSSVALATLGLMATGWWIHRKPRPVPAESRRAFPVLMAAAAIAIAAAWYAANHRLPVDFFYDTQTLLMAAALMGSILAALYHLWRFCYAGANPDDAQLTLLAAAGAAVGYSLSLSWAYYGPMVMPGLAVVAVIILDYAWSSPKTRLAAAGLCFCVVFLAATYKYEAPFAWMQWEERSSPGVVHRSPLPELAGLAMPEPTGTLVDHITRLIQENAPAGGTLFVYPYFPLFYVLTGMNPPTYGFNHYLDVAPDTVCERDARTLIEHPPSIIVRLIQPEALVRFNERYFRGGKLSGARKIVAAMDELSPSYRLLETIKLPGSGSVDLQILARK